MYGSDDNNGQQPGDNTPPPMTDAPISNDGSPMPNPSVPTDNTPSDTGAGNYMTDDSSGGMTVPEGMMPKVSGDDVKAVLDQREDSPAKDQLGDVFSQATSSASGSGDSVGDLLGLKQQALAQLAPLVDHLDQSPEDEFRTTMMMIQASDNKDLLPKAYEAAQKITDDKAKAQALLDVINEINYFTQAQHNEAN